LNILNFRNTGSLKINGSVKINGEKINNHVDLANISGYVQQDDLFISTLKVIEQLKFQVFMIVSYLFNFKIYILIHLSQ
jgi:ABC-type multidrug transport system ATPase subunit